MIPKSPIWPRVLESAQILSNNRGTPARYVGSTVVTKLPAVRLEGPIGSGYHGRNRLGFDLGVGLRFCLRMSTRGGPCVSMWIYLEKVGPSYDGAVAPAINSQTLVASWLSSIT
jgi:hypothetical protein